MYDLRQQAVTTTKYYAVVVFDSGANKVNSERKIKFILINLKFDKNFEFCMILRVLPKTYNTLCYHIGFESANFEMISCVSITI